MNYQVFARKYRPQTFDEVIGQEHITRTLKNAITQNRLAHAYLLVGPRGIGKTSTARILAKALCCVNAPTTEPCGQCDACREIAAGTSLDVLEIDGASNNGVEQVRELRENVRYAPTHGKYKIYIIDEVHMLTSAAFNALLKTLEEPPEHVKFIFATTEPHKVLPTILSRCQRFDLKRIPTHLIAQHLEKIAQLEKIQLDKNAAEPIAVGADGGLRDAESMLDQLVAFCGKKIQQEDVLKVFGFTAPAIVSKLTQFIFESKTPEALHLLDEQSAAGKDLLRLLTDFISHCRNLLVYRVNPTTVQSEVTQETIKVLETQSQLVGTDRLLELIDHLAATEQKMRWATNKKLQFEIAVIKAIQILNQASLDEVLHELTVLRNGSASKEVSVKKTSASAPVKEKKKEQQSDATLHDPEPIAAPTAAPLDLDPQELWQRLIREISAQRPLIKTWIQSGYPLSIDATGLLQVLFPLTERIAIESLNKPNNRQYLETLLSQLAARAVRLKLELQKEGEALPARAQQPEEPVHQKVAPQAAPQNAPVETSVDTSDPIAIFRNDPLIKKALELFEGEILGISPT